jgi:ABC-2 type transport system ATP-binding protein
VTEPALSLRGLRKAFGDRVAVDGVDLDVPVGSLYGLAGPNGAGKTTLLRMATTLLRPDAGEVVLDGVNVWRSPLEAKRRFGLVPDDPVLLDRLSGRELLEFSGLLRSLPPATIRERSDELLTVLDLDSQADELVADYSHGMVKKIALACALLHSPRVLILDEPFGAIDPVSAHVVEDILRRFTAGGGSVVVSSHVMDSGERLCDRLAIISSGRLVAEGSPAEIASGRRLQDAFVELVGARDLDQSGLEWLGSSSG